MFRTIARSIALMAALVPLVAAARTVPAGVNLHNGYLLIVNHIKYEDGFRQPGLVKVDERDEAHVGSAGTVTVNRCCIVAGTRYKVEIDYEMTASVRVPVSVTPRLCNIRGIPFGYAVVVYSGIIKKTPENSGTTTRFQDVHLVGEQAPEGCPTES